MAKKRFTVELTTKGAFNVEINPIDTDDLNGEDLSEDDAEALLSDSDYITRGAFSEDYKLPFSLVVYDENFNVVFKSKDLDDFKFVSEVESVMEDDDFDSNVLLQKALKEWEKRWAEERNAVKMGLYVVGWHEMKWLTYRFIIEDDAFDPSKLFFVADKKLEGLVYDDMTEPNHIFYDDHFLVAEDCNNVSDEYGISFHVMERCDDGYWDDLREI